METRRLLYAAPPDKKRAYMRLVNLWLHLLGLAAYFGSTLALAAIFFPAVESLSSPEDRERMLIYGLRIYNPLSIAALGLSLMSGAFNLTIYKAALGAEFFSRLGLILSLKLLLVFILINVGTYLSFGVAHRLVRIHLAGEHIDTSTVTHALRRLKILTWIALVLTAMITFLALVMTHPSPLA